MPIVHLHFKQAKKIKITITNNKLTQSIMKGYGYYLIILGLF